MTTRNDMDFFLYSALASLVILLVVAPFFFYFVFTAGKAKFDQKSTVSSRYETLLSYIGDGSHEKCPYLIDRKTPTDMICGRRELFSLMYNTTDAWILEGRHVAIEYALKDGFPVKEKFVTSNAGRVFKYIDFVLAGDAKYVRQTKRL